MQDGSAKAKVLVVDDTVTNRSLFTSLLEAARNATPVGTAPNGRIALAKVELLRPDVLLLDLKMPEMDGRRTLRRLVDKYPRIAAILLGEDRAEVAALQHEPGVLDVIVKPTANIGDVERRALVGQIERALDRYHRNWREIAPQELSDTLPCSAISALTATRPQSAAQTASTGGLKQSAAPQSPGRVAALEPAAPAPPKVRPTTGMIEVVAIGVSTGGPMALHQVLPKLPAELEVPVLIVLHMPVGFTRTLAEDLNRRSAIRVKEAEMGESVQPGVAYLAVGGQHLVVQRRDGQRVLLLTGEPPVNSCRPSVDVLFASVAEAYIPSRVVAVILTGMGTDGLAGIRVLHAGGAYTMAQNEATCVVYGMPRAVVDAGLADEVVPLDQIAERIAALTQRTKGKQPASVTP